MDTIALDARKTLPDGSANPNYWDIYLDADGNIAVNTGGIALAQDAASAIKTFQGEVYYDTTLGVPYWLSILGKLPPLSLVKSLFVQAAMTVPGVTAARVFLTSFVGRKFSGQVQITDAADKTFTAEL